jgi:hypothetical protein
VVHGSMVDRAKGLRPGLIWAVHLRSSGQGGPQEVRDGGDNGARRRPAGPAAELAGARLISSSGARFSVRF